MKEIYPAKVTWVDSMSHSPWVGAAEVKDLAPTTCVSIGFILEQDVDRVVLAQSFSDDAGEVGNLIVIPAVAVTQIQELDVLSN